MKINSRHGEIVFRDFNWILVYFVPLIGMDEICRCLILSIRTADESSLINNMYGVRILFSDLLTKIVTFSVKARALNQSRRMVLVVSYDQVRP